VGNKIVQTPYAAYQHREVRSTSTQSGTDTFDTMESVAGPTEVRVKGMMVIGESQNKYVVNIRCLLRRPDCHTDQV